jgi:hypothetical protein
MFSKPIDKTEVHMEKVKNLNKRIVSVILVTAMILVMLPMAPFAVLAAESSLQSGSKGAVLDLGSIVADKGTAYTWETMMGTAADGNRYAGRVWVDRRCSG